MRRTPKQSAGFTLLELMTALSVAGVLLAIGVPAFTDITRNNRLTTAANDLLRSTQVARTESIKRQVPVVVCASSDSTAATPTCNDGAFSQWIVFVDTDADWSPDVGEPVLERHPPLDPTITVRNDLNGIISYGANGFATPPVSGGKLATDRIVLCDARGNELVGTDSSAARALVVEATGRVRITKKRTEVAEAITGAGAGGCP
ncbi:GspH/FimT family pseudopilin [Peristeroidobacter agariperforans]|uniref:GspH/FimT family pseudopilin n=1 Tax=Peristeroidobacter agariperforans TaxID=268404 RepID=UPI00101C05EE|nr:GspH/FimT family pseudopilin [Peristeroidobacter agariperforans]